LKTVFIFGILLTRRDIYIGRYGSYEEFLAHRTGATNALFISRDCPLNENFVDEWIAFTLSNFPQKAVVDFNFKLPSCDTVKWP